MLLTEDLDASVLRFLLDKRSHVAILGELPLPSEAELKLKNIIEPNSEPAELPDEVGVQLRTRRSQFRETGLDYLERRTWQGPEGPA